MATESVPTDTRLLELANQAYDNAEASIDDSAPAAAATEPVDEPVDTSGDEDASSSKDTSSDGAKPKLTKSKEDRGDGRRPDGKFAKKGNEEDQDADKEVVPSDGSDPNSNAETRPASDAVTEQVRAAPPAGWSIKSKAEWDKLPAHIKADIAKREQEIDNGFRAYEGVKPYAERARQSGQSLAQALHAYTGIEDLFRRDPAAGMMHVAQNTGMTQYQAGQMFLQLAASLGASPPQAQPQNPQNFGMTFQNGQPQNAPGDQNAPGGSAMPQGVAADPAMQQQWLAEQLRQVLPQAVGPLAQRLEQIERERMQQAEAYKSQRLHASTSVIDQFRQAPEHRFYSDVEDSIGDILDHWNQTGQRTGDFAADLKRAYDEAVWRNPEIRDYLINERNAKAQEAQRAKDRDAAAKAKAAGKSVTGAIAAGASSTPPKKDGERWQNTDRLRSMAEQAFDQVQGRV